jgi:methionyl-tRNA synthetase
VNRTASLIHKNLGAVPEAGDLTEVDRALLAATAAGFDTVGGLIGRHRQKQALAEAMRVVAEVNKYLSDTAPWALKKTDPDRMSTVLHVAAQGISDCNTILSPFLPHSAQRVHEAFGRTGVMAPMPRIDEVEDLDGGPGYPILTGDYTGGPGWAPVPVVAGTVVPPPSPIFTKLDPSIVDEELQRMRGEDDPGEPAAGA